MYIRAGRQRLARRMHRRIRSRIPGGFEVSLAGSARDVCADEGVVDDSAVAGAKFNGFDFPVFCEVGWDDEDLVLIHIVAADCKGFCHW